MATEVLTDRGTFHPFDRQTVDMRQTMSKEFRGQSHIPYQLGSGGADHPTLYSEASSSGDGMPPPPIEVAPSSRKRKTSKSKTLPELRRPVSTPHIREAGQGETSPLASPTSEKRRNKLGYHRTSVACGHCRRRKIRCLLAAEDNQGRCLNCIRLKKECHFFPVDQGPGDHKAHPTVADAGSKPAPTSSHSSPRDSATSESVDDGLRMQNSASQAPFSIHSSKHSSELEYSDSPLDGGSFQSPTFSYQGMPDSAHWGQPTFLSGQALADTPNTPQSAMEYWGPQHPPNSAIFQHRESIPTGLDQQPGYYSHPATEIQPHAWTGVRSMSVGDASQLPTNFQGHYRPAPVHHAAFPFAYTQGSSQSLPLGSVDPTISGSSVAPHILPSQTISTDWSGFATQDLTTPVAEHLPPAFPQQWYNDAQHQAPGHGPGFHPPSTHPG